MLKSINPFNLETVQEYNVLSSDEVTTILSKVKKTYVQWSKTTKTSRAQLFLKLGEILRKQKKSLGHLATLEMGKPISQAISEIEKCALLCDYYAENGPRFLEDKLLDTDYQKSYVSYEPLGGILAVMPWNFPFWQVFRFAVPTILAGNVALLKHASNVPQCARAIEELFLSAGFPKNVFTNLPVATDMVESIIKHDVIQAVSLTGSNKAGGIVASQAAKNIKKAVLELGGSDAFIIDEDCRLDEAVEAAFVGRYQNNGQSCIAAKRFFVHEKIYETFMTDFTKKVKNIKMGDPSNEDIYIGPLAKKDFVKEINEQVQKSVEKGAEIRTGGQIDGEYNQFYQATILEKVKPGMPAFDEELFGPVAAIMKIATVEEAIELANQSKFGLGATIWTNNEATAKLAARNIEAGTVVINDYVKSIPNVPFGGIKQSGFGRELAEEGIHEFVNRKAVHFNS